MRKWSSEYAKSTLRSLGCLGRAFVLYGALVLAACSSSEVVVRSSGSGPPVPEEISRALLDNPGNSLRVRVYINNDSAQTKQVNNVTLSADRLTLSDFTVLLPVGVVSLYLYYELVGQICGDTGIPLARTTTLKNVHISVDNPVVDFSSARIEQLFDSDNDGISNLKELEDNTFECPVLPPPDNLQISEGDGQVTVQWGAVERAASYNIYYGAAADLRVPDYVSQGGGRLTGVKSPITISGLGNGTEYTILVTAVNAEGESGAVFSRATPRLQTESTFSVNVAVSGLNNVLVLSNYSDELSVTTDGRYAFQKLLVDGANYQVTIKQQPANQTCAVGGSATGTINSAHVFGIEVSCDLPVYPVKVLVSGLKGKELVLQNNGGDDYEVSKSGQIEFATQLPIGRSFSVTVKKHPLLPERCIVVNSTGTISAEGSANIGVECSIRTSAKRGLGGEVRGLKGRLVLKNGREERVVNSNGVFQFDLLLASGDTYSTTVLHQPSGQECRITNGDGKIADANVNNIGVDCVNTLVVDTISLSTELELMWNADDLAIYNLYVATAAECDHENYKSCANGKMLPNIHSPYRVTGLTNGQIYYYQLEAVYDRDDEIVAPEERASPGELSPNAEVRAVKVGADGTVYLGGDFTRISVPMGGGVVLDATTGRRVSAFQIEGVVRAVVADGQGGWYVGGEFPFVNGIARENLVHILADDSVNASFDFPVIGKVQSLLLVGDKLYVGGEFSSLGGANRSNLASIDLELNAVESWSPEPDGLVSALAFHDNDLYVGGSFAKIGGVAHGPVGRFNSGGTLAPWNPVIEARTNNPAINAFAFVSGRIILGGEFSGAEGQPRDSLAAYFLDGSFDVNWATIPAGSRFFEGRFSRVHDLLVKGVDLYAAGGVTNTNEPYLVALKPDTGDVRLSSDTHRWVTALEANDTNLFVGTLTATNVAAASLLLESEASWSKIGKIGEKSRVETLALAGNRLFVGGDTELDWNEGGVVRNRIAALDSSGRLLSWNPNADGSVTKLEVTPNAIYALGSFNQVGGQERLQLAAIGHNGDVLDWNPNKQGNVPLTSVISMIVLKNVLYFGGTFTEFAGLSRHYVAALDAPTDDSTATGDVTVWNPVLNDVVYALESDGDDTIFVGGAFTTVNSVDRQRLAAVGTDGTLRDTWKVDADQYVTALVRGGDTLYVGGKFLTIGGGSRVNIAAVTMEGELLTYNEEDNALVQGSDVTSMTIANHVIVTGGLYTHSVFSQQEMVALSGSNGDVLTWDPVPGWGVRSVGFDSANGRVYLGGLFTKANNRLRPWFAVVEPPVQ